MEPQEVHYGSNTVVGANSLVDRAIHPKVKHNVFCVVHVAPPRPGRLRPGSLARTLTHVWTPLPDEFFSGGYYPGKRDSVGERHGRHCADEIR